MSKPRRDRNSTRPIDVFTTPSGLGGVFTVSVTEDLGDDRVRVRVHYPSADWDGYMFDTTRDRLTAAGRKRLRS